MMWWWETKGRPSPPCLLWDTALTRNGASNPSPSLLIPLLRIGGEGLTPREGLVLSELPPSAPATASPSCSSFSPMQRTGAHTFLCFQGKRGHSFSVHLNTFSCLYGSDESHFHCTENKLVVWPSWLLDAQVQGVQWQVLCLQNKATTCFHQHHHLFVTLSHKFLFFKKFANEYVKYSTAKGQDG